MLAKKNPPKFHFSAVVKSNYVLLDKKETEHTQMVLYQCKLSKIVICEDSF